MRGRKVQGHLGDSENMQMPLEELSTGSQPCQHPPLWGDLPDVRSSDHSWGALPMGQ